jgi:hypothetical protein
MLVILALWEAVGKRIMVRLTLGKNVSPYLKITKAKKGLGA